MTTRAARLESAAPEWIGNVAERLNTRRVGSAIRYFSSLTSTNTVAREWLDEGGPDGLIVLAGEQTAGRGRRGRAWVSPSEKGLYFSVGLHPRLPPEQATWLTFLAAVGSAEGLAELGLDAEIHWPNDLEVGGRKLGGILVETRLEAGEISTAIVGIGINLHQELCDFPGPLLESATSVRMALGARPDPAAVLGSILARLDHWYDRLDSTSDTTAFGAELLSRWRELAPGHDGQAVEVDGNDGLFRGVTDGVESDGALRVRGADGRRIIVRLGDLRRVRETREEKH